MNKKERRIINCYAAFVCCAMLLIWTYLFTKISYDGHGGIMYVFKKEIYRGIVYPISMAYMAKAIYYETLKTILNVKRHATVLIELIATILVINILKDVVCNYLYGFIFVYALFPFSIVFDSWWINMLMQAIFVFLVIVVPIGISIYEYFSKR